MMQTQPMSVRIEDSFCFIWQEVQPAAPAFKTVLCKYFELGHCTRGDECTYAHGIEELQTREALKRSDELFDFDDPNNSPKFWNFFGKLLKSNSAQAGTYKTVLCKFFEAGSCSRGASCTFAHGDGDLLAEAPSATAAPSAGACAVAATAWPMTSLADAIAQRRLGSRYGEKHGENRDG